jgi:hypothetical protein
MSSISKDSFWNRASYNALATIGPSSSCMSLPFVTSVKSRLRYDVPNIAHHIVPIMLLKPQKSMDAAR